MSSLEKPIAEELSEPSSPPVQDVIKTTCSPNHEDIEPARRLHAKAYLAVFTVCLIYYAQLVNLVGAGAVLQPTYSRLYLVVTIKLTLFLSKLKLFRIL